SGSVARPGRKGPGNPLFGALPGTCNTSSGLLRLPCQGRANVPKGDFDERAHLELLARGDGQIDQVDIAGPSASESLCVRVFGALQGNELYRLNNGARGWAAATANLAMGD
ncbi:MAG TPA: hypothetical protein VIO16_05090, partial [Dehalococcoidia bacterium]